MKNNLKDNLKKNNNNKTNKQNKQKKTTNKQKQTPKLTIKTDYSATSNYLWIQFLLM